jgi:hypothetical protein
MVQLLTSSGVIPSVLTGYRVDEKKFRVLTAEKLLKEIVEVFYRNPPLELASCGRVTGIEASMFFYYRNVPEPFPKRFSANFEAAADPNSFLLALAAYDPKYLNFKPLKSKVVLEELGDIPCIKMSCEGDSLLQEWWLDPNRGYALLRHVNMGGNRDGSSQVKSSIDVTRLKEVAEGIWWPMEAYFVQCPRETGKPWKRIVYQAENVVANDPDFNKSIFTIHFPKGYTIDDKVTGKKYKVGEEPNAPKEPSKN